MNKNVDLTILELFNQDDRDFNADYDVLIAFIKTLDKNFKEEFISDLETLREHFASQPNACLGISAVNLNDHISLIKMLSEFIGDLWFYKGAANVNQSVLPYHHGYTFAMMQG